MKKVLFLSLAASAVMASCSNEVLDSVVPQEPQAISFGNAYVDNNTRADINSIDNLETIYAFGAKGSDVTTAISTLANKVVTKQGKTWVYDPVLYWEEGVNYKFIAYSDGNALIPTKKESAGVSFDAKTGNLTFTDYTVGANDLIVSQVASPRGQADNNSEVELTLQHVLSKVTFTFTNGCGAGSTITITDLKFNANQKGTYTTEKGKWAPTTSATDFTYQNDNMKGIANGAQNTNEYKYVIPQSTTSITASFKVTLENETLTNPHNYQNKEFTVSLDLGNGAPWVKGNIYNYTATITPANFNLEPIVFTPAIGTDWVTATQVVTPVE